MARPLVVALALDRFHPFELGVACEVFGADRRDLLPAWFRFAVAGPRRVASSVGAHLVGLSDLSVVGRAGLVIVAGWERLEEAPSPAVLSALRRAHARGATVMSYCSGAFALGHAGLLDGRRATTHWMFAERLARCFPGAQVDPRPLWVRDGNIWTAAGTAAAIDCSLAWLVENVGQTVANEVARRMVVAPARQGGQAQFIARSLPEPRDRLAAARDAVEANPGARHTVSSLARLAAMSPRSFARHFLAQTGATPYAWVLACRLAMARHLLESSELGIEEVAARVGMDPANLRRRFREQHGLSPVAWRLTFGQAGRAGAQRGTIGRGVFGVAAARADGPSA